MVETTRERTEEEKGLLKGPGGGSTSHRATGEARMSQTWVRHQGHDTRWPFLLPQLTSLGISAASFLHCLCTSASPRDGQRPPVSLPQPTEHQDPIPQGRCPCHRRPMGQGIAHGLWGTGCRSAPRLLCVVLVHLAPGMAFGPLGQCLSVGNQFLCRAGQVPGLAMKSDVDCVRLTPSWFARERCCCAGSPGSSQGLGQQ